MTLQNERGTARLPIEEPMTEEERGEVAMLASVLRTRGRGNSLHDINRAADWLEALSAPPAPVGGGARHRFEDFPALAESVEFMATHVRGVSLIEWQKFTDALNAALSSPPLQGDQGLSPLQSPAAPCAPVVPNGSSPARHEFDWTVPAESLPTDQLLAEEEYWGREFDDLRASLEEDGGCSGSPGEWMYERLDEIATTLKRRAAGKPTETPTDAQPEGRSLPND